jgi:hypothetical protein
MGTTELKALAMEIVNKVFQIAETPLELREDRGIVADEIVEKILRDEWLELIQ